ncbi:gamma-tubulin complex component 6 isoform X2 [Syngnathus typhle]|uniref:gamma-tubulin complex component 6 isoform X2 n=1 Tax=Syngnathus typhle TaxID=161592 RepID=UPI002A6AD107|nr:gamma-tubulin complex component 6 isoform X2 [Syngnathus typhle]
MYSSSHHPIKSGCNTGASITELLAALCDSSLAGVSWKRRALGGVSREGFRKALKKRAYGALLSKLFQDGAKPPVTLEPSSPPRNRVLMICFDLRVAGCREEAERLEDLLETLPEGAASGLNEVDSVLELLVHLAGTSPPPPPSFSRDYMRRERPVLRRPAPWPYQSEELQRLEARAWGLVCGEEWASLERLYGTQGLMEAQPGAGLMALRTKTDVEERFEKETRLTLFGALQHTRTSDLDIRLDLPPVPSDVDVTGLSIRVPPCLDQSDDEGFQSGSNLTPDSLSEPSPGPDMDVWEALRTFEPGVRCCWESVGWPPGRRDSLYLSESGREAFDQLYRLWEGEMRVVSGSVPSPILPLPVDSQGELVGDLLNVLIAGASATFPLNQNVEFDVRPGVCVSGASPESVSRLLGELAQYGTYYLRLSRFSLQSPEKKGLVFQAFTGGLRKYLHYYRACVLSTPPRISLLTVGFLFRKVGQQLRYLSELCRVDGPPGGDRPAFPVGVKLLSHLYNEVQNNCSNENYPVLLSLLKSSCEPYTRFVSDWVYSGVFRDVYGEFMIQVNEEYLGFRDKHFWVQGYTLISQDVEECVPVFLRHMANDVYVCGKTINLLKICCPQHYICLSELPVPRIAVTFSLQEVEAIERDCAVYRGRMERIAKHSAVSREVQAQRAEEARQELINQVRASAAKTLESIRGHQVSQRLAEEARKRESFQELKQHLEKEQEWRTLAKKKQEEDDFSFARELRDREKRLQALEEQLEQRARKELIAQYSQLSEEAARKERRALWRSQRTTLDEARSHFFARDQQELQAILEKYPLGQERPPVSSPQQPPALILSSQESPSEQSVEKKPENPEESKESHSVDTSPFISGDFLPESLTVNHTKQEETAEACPTAKLVDYDFSAPFSPLEGIAGQPSLARLRPVCGSSPLQPDVICNHPSFSHFPVGENMPLVQESLPAASPFGHVSECSFSLRHDTPREPANVSRANGPPPQVATLLGQGDASVRLERDKLVGAQDATAAKHKEDAPHLSICSRVCSLASPLKRIVVPSPAHPSDSHIKIGELVSDADAPPPSQNVHGHSSDANIKVGENVSDFVHPLFVRNLHGHASDAHLKVGGNDLDLLPPLPVPNVHGHASDANIKVGENVSDFVHPLLLRNPHGHASDAHLKVGGNDLDLLPPLPVPNVHGHASDANIKVGENVSDFVHPLLLRNPHGHASDAHLKVGGNDLDLLPPLPVPNVHGHASDANIKVGENVSNFVQLRPVRNPHGHASDAHLKVGGNDSDFLSPLPVPNVHGHASDSSIKVGENVSDVSQARPRWSKHGHASDSTLQVGCVVSGSAPAAAPESDLSHVSDSSLGSGCVVTQSQPLPSPLPVSQYGHSSDSALGVGCVVLGLPKPSLSTERELEGKADHEQDAEAVSFDLSPGEKSEQEYLLALSAHYQVERYEDCSSLMASSPECQLLKRVIRGLPAEPALRHATDATAVHLNEMVSLPVLIKHSVTAPLITHMSLVNKAVVDYFFVEMGVERHFEALRHFLLMEDGEFAQSLSDRLFEKLGSGQTPGELLTPLVLNSILSKALQYSLHGDTPLAANFTFALRFLPDTFHPHAPDSLNCLELRYKVAWPLNIIITDTCMNKYNRLFSFQLQLKHMVWSLRDVWFHLKRTAVVKGAGRSVQFRQLQLYRHEMQHFVKVIQGYIANQILQVSWSEFTAKMAAACDLDAIHRTHADYLNRAIFRALLTDKAAPVMNIIHSIFSLILKFRAQLIALPWTSQQGETVHPSFIAMQQSYNTFKYYSHFLFKVVTKLVNRGYQPHLEDFLLRINFNNYYKDS